ncbi:Peptidase family M50 [uncultured archaeon]|nr:Peptidase family M50 [uncultured archaeon]
MSQPPHSPSSDRAGKEKPLSPSEEPYDLTKPIRGLAGKFGPKDLRAKVAVLAVLALATIAAFAFLLGTGLSALEKFMGSALIMVISGELARGLMGWEGFAGLILLKDRSTLNWIDRQAQAFAPFWSVVADVGLVMGYGFGSLLLLGPQSKKPKTLLLIFAVGLPMLVIFSAGVMPSAYDVLRYSLSGNGDLAAATAHMRATAPLQGTWDVMINGQMVHVPFMTILSVVVIFAGGLAASVTLSLLLYAISLLGPILAKVGSMAFGLLGQAAPAVVVPPPGASPLLPGVNLPLVEGIIAMAVLLVVHELSHAFVARVHKIRLDSAGVVFFGVLPFGAFVDPDEKELDGVEAWKSTQVIVAGSAMNMLTATVAFCIFMGLSVLNYYYPMHGIGVGFIARTLGLVIALNVLVGVVNLLPITLVDGHRLMKAAVRNELAANLITWAVIAAFVVNFLPWLFR